MKPPRAQRGVALLAAILIVAVATVIAADIAFQSAMSARRGTASLSFEETMQIAGGAEALAGYALRQSTSPTVSLTDPWATPLPPTEVVPGVTLAAAMEDLQGRFNLNTLVYQDGSIDPDALAALEHIFEAVGVEPEWADKIADWIDSDMQTNGPGGLEDAEATSQNPPYRTPNTYITSTSELLALPGFGRDRYRKIAPFVAALPPGTTINVCTAPAVLLDAMVAPGFRQFSADAKQTAQQRTSGCYPTLTQYQDVLQADGSIKDAAKLAAYKQRFGDKSQYFRLTSLVTIGDSEFVLYSVLKRTGNGQQGKVRVLQRGFTAD